MAQAKSSESSSSQPRKRGRKLLWLGGVLIVLLVALVGAAPTLVSMGVGQTYIVDQISARIEGDVEIDRLSVGWFSGQTIEGLRLSHKGKELLRVDRVEAPDVSLLGLVRGDLDVGTLRVVHPRPDVHVAEDGTIDLLAALQSTAPPTAKPEPARWPKGLKARIEIINGIIKLSAVGSKPIEADDVNVNIDASDPANIAAKLGGVVKQGGHSGSVDIAATLRDLVDADGAIDHARATLGGKATAADVPMDPIDEVLAKLLPQRDTLRSVIGPKATGTLTFDGTMEDVSITFDIDSRSLKGTQVKARYVNGMLTIDDTTTLKLRVLPETWPTIAALAGLNPRDTTLREAFDVTLTPQGLKVPLNQSVRGLLKADGSLRAETGDFTLAAGDERFGVMAFEKPWLKLAANQRDKRLSVTGHLIAKQGDQTGELEINGNSALPSDPTQLASWLDAQPKITTKMHDLPMAAIDKLSPLAASLEDLFGPTLSVDATVVRGEGSFDASVTLRAKKIEQGDLRLALEDGVIRAREGSAIILQLDDAGWQSLRTLAKLDELPVELAPSRATLRPKQFALPFDEKRGINWLKSNATIALGLNALQPDRADAKQLDPRAQIDITFDGKQRLARLDLDVTPMLGGQTLSTLKGDFTAHDVLDDDGRWRRKPGRVHGKLNAVDLERDLALALAKQTLPEMIEALTGKRVTASVSLDITPAQNTGFWNGKVTISGATGVVDSLALDVTLDGKQLTIKPGKVAAVKIDPPRSARLSKLFEASLPESWRDIEIVDTVNGHVMLDQFEVALDFDKGIPKLPVWKQATMACRVVLPGEGGGRAIAFRKPTRLEGIGLGDVVITLPKGRLGDALPIIWKGQLYERSGKRYVAAGTLDGTATWPLAKDTVLSAKVTARQVPARIVESIVGMPGQLQPWAGETIGEAIATIKPTSTPGAFAYSVTLGKTQTTAKLAGTLSRDRIVIARGEGSFIAPRITPQSFNAYRATLAEGHPLRNYDLVEAADLRIALDDVALALPKRSEGERDEAIGDAKRDNAKSDDKPLRLPILADASRVDTTISGQGLKLRRRSDKAIFEIGKFSLRADSQSLAKRIALTVDIPLTSPGEEGKTQSGAIKGTIDLADLFNANGELTPGKAAASPNLTLSRVPMRLVALLAPNGAWLEAAVGPYADGSIKGKLPGDVDIALKGTSASASIALNADKDRVLTLREDATITVTPSQELGDRMAAAGMPFLIGATDNSQPVTVIIAKDKFRVPLDDFELSKLNVDASVKPTQLALKGGGWFRTNFYAGMGQMALSMAGTKLPLVDPKDTVSTDLTQSSLGMTNGVVQLGETWVRMPDLAMGVRGSMNMKTGERRFVVAVPGKVITHWVGALPGLRGKEDTMKQIIPPNEIFEFPVVTKEDGSMGLDFAQFSKEMLAIQIRYQGIQRLFGDKRAAAIAAPLVDALLKKAMDGGSKHSWKAMPAWQPPDSTKSNIPDVDGKGTDNKDDSTAKKDTSKQDNAKPSDGTKDDADKAQPTPGSIFGDLLEKALERKRQREEEKRKREEAERKKREQEEEAKKRELK